MKQKERKTNQIKKDRYRERSLKEKNKQQSGQCDQIGRFIALWATYQSPWQQLFFPNRPHS